MAQALKEVRLENKSGCSFGSSVFAGFDAGHCPVRALRFYHLMLQPVYMALSSPQI